MNIIQFRRVGLAAGTVDAKLVRVRQIVAVVNCEIERNARALDPTVAKHLESAWLETLPVDRGVESRVELISKLLLEQWVLFCRVRVEAARRVRIRSA